MSISISALFKFMTYANRSTTGGKRTCPYCAEKIKAAAIVCRYCQRDLPPFYPDNSWTASELVMVSFLLIVILVLLVAIFWSNLLALWTAIWENRLEELGVGALWLAVMGLGAYAKACWPLTEAVQVTWPAKYVPQALNQQHATWIGSVLSVTLIGTCVIVGTLNEVLPRIFTASFRYFMVVLRPLRPLGRPLLALFRVIWFRLGPGVGSIVIGTLTGWSVLILLMGGDGIYLKFSGQADPMHEFVFSEILLFLILALLIADWWIYLKSRDSASRTSEVTLGSSAEGINASAVGLTEDGTDRGVINDNI